MLFLATNVKTSALFWFEVHTVVTEEYYVAW
jgi:hypothetical protein